MRVVLDTCVLIPSSIRGLLVRVAEKKLFSPIWSERIFEEWEFFASKNSMQCIYSTRIEILLLKSKWKNSFIPRDICLEEKLLLPDENDRHVLASAIKGRAQILLTNNLRDFPSRLLSKYGIIPRSVDSFLLELLNEYPQIIEPIITAVFESHKGNNPKVFSKKAFLKRCNLPRLAKTIMS